MIGLVALVLMIVLTFLFFSDLDIKMVIGFWAAYILTWFLPFIGIPSFVAAIGGLCVAGAYFVAAKAA